MNFFEFAYNKIEGDKKHVSGGFAPLGIAVYNAVKFLLYTLQGQNHSGHTLCSVIKVLYDIATKWDELNEESKL